jgi:poly-gamma-glutamate capsule biosynthesis protein CapA/YwtB (metallophosphatase superfamily)
VRALVVGAGVAIAALCGLAARAPAGGSPDLLVSAAGDIAMATSADGGRAFFAHARGALVGDVVLGNLEGTLARDGSPRCTPNGSTCFVFRAPPSYARVLRRAGFTVLNLANNHAFDYGRIGSEETVAALDEAGLEHTGRPGEGAFPRAQGITVGIVGFAPYPWAQDLRDIAAAKRIVRAADGFADVVIVAMHAGAEGAGHRHVRPGTETYLGEDRGNTVAFAHAVVDAGADLVLGSGPHVLRGMEWYRGRLIAYSLGNFLGNGTLSIAGSAGVSCVLQARLHGDGTWAGGKLVPIRLVRPGFPVRDAGHEAFRDVRSLSRADFGPRGMRVSPTGTLVPPRA